MENETDGERQKKGEEAVDHLLITTDLQWLD